MTLRALRAAAEVAGAPIFWIAGQLCAMNITNCNTWERNALLVVGCLVLEFAGLWLMTNWRTRLAREAGYESGSWEAWKKADSMMRDFIMKKAVIMLDASQMPKPEQEKAPPN